MIEILFELYLRTILQALPILTAAASGRRAYRSRSVNGVLYACVFLFSCAAAIGMSSGLFEGRPAEAGAMVMAVLCVPLWAVVRELTRRPEDLLDTPNPAAPAEPRFASTRPGSQAEARGTGRRLRGPVAPR
ncbi:MAG: hypothetical protein AAGA71_13485 [Pseudomonadota bacterium]